MCRVFAEIYSAHITTHSCELPVPFKKQSKQEETIPSANEKRIEGEKERRKKNLALSRK